MPGDRRRHGGDTGAQAVALAETAEFDAALLDINLNGENSFPVAHILGKRGVASPSSPAMDGRWSRTTSPPRRS